MYPSVENPSYGVFVKNFETQINSGHEINVSQKIVISTQGGSKREKIGRYLRFYLQIFKALLGRKYDQVYVHFPTYVTPVLLLWSKGRKKLILNFHGSDVIGSGRMFRVFERLTKIVINKADLIIAPSTFLAAEIEERLSASKEKIFISPSGGVNKEYFYPIKKVKARKNIGIANQFTIGFISRLDVGKGWDVFVEAVAILRQRYKLTVQAIVIGDGQEKQEFLTRIKELEIEDITKYYGRKKQAELASYFSSLDICVASSTLMESLGLIGLESMSCGVPVAGSNRAGIATYVVDGSNGFLFSPGSADELAEVVMKYHSMDTISREKLSFQALETAKNYEAVFVNKKLIERLQGL